MPFNQTTPESLLGRSDSKNPATTCRGLTTAGKPCRRSLAAGSSGKQHTLQPGVLAVVNDRNGRPLDATFYCWQHKDQAQPLTSRQETARPTRFVTITERTSIDSLVDRLGVAHISDPMANKTTSNHSGIHVAANRHSERHVETLHPALIAQKAPGHSSPPKSSAPAKARPKSSGFFASLCCFGSSNDDDYYEIVRHKRRPEVAMQQRRHDQDIQVSSSPSLYNLVPATAQKARLPPPRTLPVGDRRQSSASRQPLTELPIMRNLQRTQTQQFLSFIPPHATPETAALLLNELSKPISPHDAEGYIYIFWLTDSDKVPDRATTSSLLGSTASRSNLDGLVRNYSVRTTSSRKILLLKIGRANNVHRRMTEWTQQCGHALSLLRWYPYVSSPSSSPVRNARGVEVRKVPHVHRVERLIHLELAGRRVKRDCAACGKEHREWFEIDASADAVGAVDETVRRWVRWAEESV